MMSKLDALFLGHKKGPYSGPIRVYFVVSISIRIAVVVVVSDERKITSSTTRRGLDVPGGKTITNVVMIKFLRCRVICCRIGGGGICGNYHGICDTSDCGGSNQSMNCGVCGCGGEVSGCFFHDLLCGETPNLIPPNC